MVGKVFTATFKETAVIAMMNFTTAFFSWLVASAVIIYRSHGDVSYEPWSQNYCHPTLYKMTFWVVTIHWGMVAVAFTIGVLAITVMILVEMMK